MVNRRERVADMAARSYFIQNGNICILCTKLQIFLYDITLDAKILCKMLKNDIAYKVFLC